MTQPRDRGRGLFAPTDSYDPATGQRDPWSADPSWGASREGAGVEPGGAPYEGGVPIAPATAGESGDGMTPSERFYVRAQQLRREAREMDRAMQSVARTGKPAGAAHPATGERWDYEGWTAGDFRAERDRLDAAADGAERLTRFDRSGGISEIDPSPIHLAQSRPIPRPTLPPPPAPFPTTTVPPTLPTSPAPFPLGEPTKPHVPANPRPKIPLTTPPTEPFRVPPLPPTSGVPLPNPEPLIFVPPNIPSYPLGVPRQAVRRQIVVDSPQAMDTFLQYVGYAAAQAAVVDDQEATALVRDWGRLGKEIVRIYNRTIQRTCIEMAKQRYGSGVVIAELTEVLARNRGRRPTQEGWAPGEEGRRGSSYADGGFIVGDTWFVFNTATRNKRGFTPDEVEAWERLVPNFKRLHRNSGLWHEKVTGKMIDKPGLDEKVDLKEVEKFAEKECRDMFNEAEARLYLPKPR